MIIALHIAILAIFYWIGTWIQEALALFIPGSIIGMLLLFSLLLTKVIPLKLAEKGSFFILRHMPLLFLPVTVGILQFLDLFSGKGIFIVVITIVSTLVILAIVGLLGERFLRWKEVDK